MYLILTADEEGASSAAIFIGIQSDGDDGEDWRKLACYLDMREES
jgi:hypothetical protein